MWDPHYIKKKRKLWSSFLFLNFGLSGCAENEIYAFWFQKWPRDGPTLVHDADSDNIEK